MLPAKNLTPARQSEPLRHRVRVSTLQRQILELAAHRLGELLIEGAETGARRKSGVSRVSSPDDTVAPPTLSDLGITRDESSECQKLAAIPEAEFEAKISGPAAEHRAPANVLTGKGR